MVKTPIRFTVRKVKCCYRNSMIAGNPITHSFERFGIYDKDWNNDRFRGLSAFNNVLKNKNQSGKFRRLYDTREEADAAAAEMNRLWNECGRPAMIKFNDWGEIKLEKMESKYSWNH